MKKIISMLSLLLLPFMCFAQLRSQVCIIKQNYDDKMIETVKSMEKKIKLYGVKDTKKYLETFMENGSFGSGFVYIAPNGKKYVITNRHVIEDSKMVTVSFQDDNGEIAKEYKNVKILAADAEIDVAILELPEDENAFVEGIEFCKENIKDGDSVYTAGYPGLMGKPSWQFGAGIVTNANIKNEELIKPELSSVIQHSAQIDPGNSGGPLLIKKDNGSYQVVGINTWKATSRQDTNFAIPISTVEKFINNVLSPEGYTQPAAEQLILSRAQSLQKILNSFNATFEEIAPFISNEYITEEGAILFSHVLNNCSSNNKDVICGILVAGYPVEALRYVIAWNIFNTYHKDEIVFNKNKKATIAEEDLPEIPSPVKYADSDIWYTPLFQNSTNRFINFEWINVNGGWQVYSCANIAERKIGTKNKRFDAKQDRGASAVAVLNEVLITDRDVVENLVVLMPTKTSISVFGGSADLSTYQYGIDYEQKITNIIALDCTLNVVENHVNIHDYGKTNLFIKDCSAYTGIQFQVPGMIKRLIIMPYLTAQCGYTMHLSDSFSSSVGFRSELGLRTNFIVGKRSQSLFVDAELNWSGDLYNFSTSKTEINKYPGFAIGAGIAF